MPTRRCAGRAEAAMLGAVLVLLVTTTADAGRYMTNGFRTSESRPMSVALVPPHAEFVKAKAVMTEQMVKECQALETAAASVIEKMLADKGYSVKRVAPDQLREDPSLREMVLQLNERYDQEWSKIVRRPKRVHYERYSGGAEARRLAGKLGVDGVVIPRIQAVGVSGGKKALTMLLSFGNYMAQGYARLDLAVIDGDTGDVEAYFFYVKAANLKPLTRKPDKIMGKLAEATLRGYPESSELLKARGQTEEEEEEKEEVDEAALLGELEALLGPDEVEEAGEEEADGP